MIAKTPHRYLDTVPWLFEWRAVCLQGSARLRWERFMFQLRLKLFLIKSRDVCCFFLSIWKQAFQTDGDGENSCHGVGFASLFYDSVSLFMSQPCDSLRSSRKIRHLFVCQKPIYNRSIFQNKENHQSLYLQHYILLSITHLKHVLINT